MVKCKKTPPKQQPSEKTNPSKDTNSQAREEFLSLITADDTLNPAWKDTLTPLVSEKILDDLSPLQDLIDGVPYAKTQATKN